MDPNNLVGRLPMENEGDSDRESIFTEVGRALTHWESMEYTLSETYEALLDAKTDGATVGYGLLVAFSGRHALVESAELHLPFRDDSELRPLRDLIARASKLASRRNEIAHGVVAHVHMRGYYLVPAWYSSNKAPKHDFSAKFNHGIGSYAYTAAQITTYGERFSELDKDLSRYLPKIRSAWSAEPG